MLAYKTNAAEAADRLRSLYERRAEDRILATMSVPSKTLAEFERKHVAGECGYPDLEERALFWDAFLSERMALEDDSMPTAYLSEMDQGLYGGLLGGQVRFLLDPSNGWISSMLAPLLKNLSELDQLRLDKTHPWWQRYVNQIEVFARRSEGKWGIGHFILIDSLNFVFELVGATEGYMAIEDRPDVVLRAIALGHDLNVAIHEEFFHRVSAYQGGTFSHFAQWIPGRIVNESLDPFHMTSVSYFEKWGREPAERMMTHFDGGIIHIHANGRHLLEAASTLRGLKAIRMMDDAGFPLSFDIADKLRARVGDVPLILTAPYNAFIERLDRHELPGGVLYQVENVPTVDEANRIAERVRAYQA